MEDSGHGWDSGFVPIGTNWVCRLAQLSKKAHVFIGTKAGIRGKDAGGKCAYWHIEGKRVDGIGKNLSGLLGRLPPS